MSVAKKEEGSRGKGWQMVSGRRSGVSACAVRWPILRSFGLPLPGELSTALIHRVFTGFSPAFPQRRKMADAYNFSHNYYESVKSSVFSLINMNKYAIYEYYADRGEPPSYPHYPQGYPQFFGDKPLKNGISLQKAVDNPKIRQSYPQFLSTALSPAYPHPPPKMHKKYFGLF